MAFTQGSRLHSRHLDLDRTLLQGRDPEGTRDRKQPALVQYAIKHSLIPPLEAEVGRRIALNTGVDTVNFDSG